MRWLFRQLCEKSGINRGTFYLHYQDKYDLLDQLKAQTIQDLMAILSQTDQTPQALIQKALDYLYSDMDFYRTIANSHHFQFSESIKSFLISLVEQTPQAPQHITALYQIPEPYALETWVARIESLISYWVRKGEQESPQELSQMILKVSKYDRFL